MEQKPNNDYDVVILGGAFSGASSAILLLRERPELRVLVLEKQKDFDQKVGEATTEMAGMFITRRLALWEHLEQNHLPKEGLRYWSHNEKVTGHSNASEAGGFHRSTVPSFQLRRDILDEHLLTLAAKEGAEVWRPARVKDVEIGEYDHRLEVEREGALVEVRCKWVIDATGRVTFLGRKLGLIERNDEHPIAAMWCRWRGVRHIDDLAARDQHLAAMNCGSRRLAANHYPGRGYWTWVIPLQNGETSIGIVWDKRLIRLHECRDRETGYDDHLRSIPPMAELLEEAERKDGDFHFYSHLPYVTKQYVGKGWALVGDSAAFLDPYYSPGLDHAAFSIDATVKLVEAFFDGEDIEQRLEFHNEVFLRSYRRFYRALYEGKYEYMGEHDLLTAAAILDTAHYYIFLVIPSYRFAKTFQWMPVLGPKEAIVGYPVMLFYNRRLRRLANLREEMGEAGRRNDSRRVNMFFTLGPSAFHMLLRGLKLWAFAELDGVRLLVRKLFGGRVKKANAEVDETANTEVGTQNADVETEEEAEVRAAR